MRVIGVGGMPATGKTSLFREVLARTGGRKSWPRFKKGLVVYHRNETFQAVILGDYSKSGTFGGTDRLSMAVQKDAVERLRVWQEKGRPATVLFEGDRLWNGKFFQSVSEIEGVELRLIELAAGEDVLEERHKDRADNQTEKWLAGRRTKLANLSQSWPILSRPNGNQQEMELTADLLVGILKGKPLPSAPPIPKIHEGFSERVSNKPPASHVRMVQLFLNDTTFPEFQKMVKFLLGKKQDRNHTDLVMRCLKEEYRRVQDQKNSA